MRAAGTGPRHLVTRVRLGVTIAAVMVLAACSAAPSPEEVVPDGRLPQRDTWCGFLDDEHVAALVGEGDADRIRQVGDLTPDGGVSPDCDVVLADGAEPVVIVQSTTTRVSGGMYFLEELRRLQDRVGSDERHLSAGDVAELVPGVYHDASEQLVAVHQACRTDETLPTLLTTSVWLPGTATGRALSSAELTELAERLVELTPWVHGCRGQVTPLSAADLEPLAQEYEQASGDP